jgi:hypothetical protein
MGLEIPAKLSVMPLYSDYLPYSKDPGHASYRDVAEEQSLILGAGRMWRVKARSSRLRHESFWYCSEASECSNQNRQNLMHRHFPVGWRPTSFYPAASCESQELVEDCSVPITNASSGPSCIETALSEFIWGGESSEVAVAGNFDP